MPITTYGDISPRTAAYASKDFLERGLPYLVLEKFGEAKTLPERSSKVFSARRYNALDATPKILQEGVTPVSSMIDYTDVTCPLVQLGDRVVITDVVQDTHEDPVMKENTSILGEQGAEMVELYRWGILRAGTNVCYADGVAGRDQVVEPASIGLQRAVIATLKNQRARKITNIVRSTPSYGTVNVAPSFIGLIHPNLQPDIEALPGFKAVEDYGQISPYENEIGKAGEVRYLTSTVFDFWPDAGGTPAGGGTDVQTGPNGQADVYPILYLGARAYALVALKGKFAVTIMVTNPKPSDSDPMAQRGHIAWKTMQGAMIQNDLWMVRAEVAVRSFM